MKIKILLLGAAVTAFTFSTFAADALLTPRQQDNQPKIVTGSISTQGGTVTYITSDSPALLSPRAEDNQLKVVTSSISTQGGTVTYIISDPTSPLTPRPTTVAPLK